MRERIIIPYIKIKPNYLTLYYQSDNSHNRGYNFDDYRSSWENSINNLKENSSDGVLSQKSSKALKTAVNWLEHLSKNQKVYCEDLKKDVKFKLNFITLTLPSPQVKGYCDLYGNYEEIESCINHVALVRAGCGFFDWHYDDLFCKKELLNHFLVLLRREFNVHNYIWRAESQKNGNIHFHITLNKYIWLKDLRNLWNRVLSKTNFINRYTEKFSCMSFEQYRIYRYQHGNPHLSDVRKSFDRGVSCGWSDPNSTDVHAVWKIRNIGAYLAEYLTKNNSSYRKIEGNLWRNSMLLSKLKAKTLILSGELDSEARNLFSNFKNRVIVSEWCSILTFSIKDLSFMFKDSLIVREFIKYKNEIFDSYFKQSNLVFEDF